MYGGVQATVPANSVAALLKVTGVAAVQRDALEQPQDDNTAFIGATNVWPSLGGQDNAASNVIVGVLDTGIWPENPMFADRGLPPLGRTFPCQFGDGTDVAHLGPTFSCNNKLVGAYAFLNTNLAVSGTDGQEFCNATTGKCSARDSEGHGTHIRQFGKPLAVEPDLGARGIEDHHCLIEVGLRVPVDLLVGEDWPLRRPSGGVADPRRVVTDDQDARMALVLKRTHPLQRNRPADVDVRRGDVDPQLHPQGPAELQLLLQAACREHVDRVRRQLVDAHEGARLPRFWRPFGETHAGPAAGGSASSDFSPSSSSSGCWAWLRSPSGC